MLRSPQRLVVSAVACALAMVVALAVWAGATDSSEAQQGTMHNCPPAGKWSIAVWEGESGTAAADALAACGAGAVAAAYSLDSQTGAWSRWFAGKPDVSNLAPLNDMQGVLALGSNVSVDDDPSWGPADAPVTVVEFSDFQCPYCARFVTDTYPQIKQQYEGKIRFVFRDFPLSTIHENAEKAAEAAGCANEQGKFWEYHDILFNNQQALDVASLKNYASQLGLDTAAFNQCLDSGTRAQEIQKDYQDGISYGVQGTPAFFVNGLLVSGAQPLSVFQSAIDAALQEAGG